MKLRASIPLLAVALLAGCGSSSSTQPAATVNGHDISMAQFDAEFHIERVQERDKVGFDACTQKGLGPACSLIKKQSLNTVIDQELVRQYAAKHGMSVSAAQDRRNWQSVFRTRFDNQQAVLNAFLKHTGETLAQLRAGLRYDLLQNEVIARVTQKMPLIVPAIRAAHFIAASRTELQIIRSMLAGGASVTTITKFLQHNSPKGCGQQYSGCGELGWVPLAFVPTKQIKTAPVGKLVGPFPEHIGNATLYDVYLVQARSPRYVLTQNQAYTMRQQVFQQWLARRQAQARVKRYITV